MFELLRIYHSMTAKLKKCCQESLCPPYVIEQAIIFLLCGLFLSFFFFSSPNLSGRRVDVYHTSTWCGLSANLECKSEMCCTRLAGNTGRKSRQKSPSAYHRTTLSHSIFATKACIDNRKKCVKQQYVLHMFPLHGELRSING